MQREVDFERENEGVGRGNGGSLRRDRDRKIHKKWEGGLVHVKPIRVCELALLEVRLQPSHRGGGPVFRCWLKQTVNSVGILKFF